MEDAWSHEISSFKCGRKTGATLWSTHTMDDNTKILDSTWAGGKNPDMTNDDMTIGVQLHERNPSDGGTIFSKLDCAGVSRYIHLSG